MNETPPPLRVFAITARGRSSPSRAASVSANARRSWPSQRRHRPAERAELLLEVAEVADLRDPRVRLHLVAVDDHGDLAEPAVRGRLERLPELTLLELAVAGEHVDPTRAPEHAIGEHETACLRDAHAERAGAGHDLRRCCHVGVAGQAVEAAELVDQVEVEPAEGGQHRVQPGRVVALRREVAVAVAEHLEVEPGDDVDRAEASSRDGRSRRARSCTARSGGRRRRRRRPARPGRRRARQCGRSRRAPRSAARSSPPRPLHLCPPVPLLEGGAHELRLLQRALDACLQRLRA